LLLKSTIDFHRGVARSHKLSLAAFITFGEEYVYYLYFKERINKIYFFDDRVRETNIRNEYKTKHNFSHALYIIYIYDKSI